MKLLKRTRRWGTVVGRGIGSEGIYVVKGEICLLFNDTLINLRTNKSIPYDEEYYHSNSENWEEI